jgi:alpha-amylase
MSRPVVTLYLHAHQPWRVRSYGALDTANRHDYFSGDGDQNNKEIFLKVANKSYRPMNALLEKLLHEHPGFCLSLSLSGVFLEQAEQFAPDVIESFQRLVKTGRVELLASPYHHSLAFFYDQSEFEKQVALHAEKIKQLFGVSPKVLANTELAYNDELGAWAEAHGYNGVLAEGWDKVLGWRSPNYVYQPKGATRTRLLLKNYRLSDDIAFRFSNKKWSGWPLTAETYSSWLTASGGPLVNLFMDYETFGEHQWKEHGIFTFFERFVGKWITAGGQFNTVSQALSNAPVGDVSMPETVTWADSERDLTAWNGNALQQEALRYVYQLAPRVLASGDSQLIRDWRNLQTSDHYYYMCTKWSSDGDVHAYFSPYSSPYEASLYVMNALRDIYWRSRHARPIT